MGLGISNLETQYRNLQWSKSIDGERKRNKMRGRAVQLERGIL
jgi:hypothetical protein